MRKQIGYGPIFFTLIILFVISVFFAEDYFLPIVSLGSLFLFLTFYNLGKKIILVEIVAFFAIIQWLLAPIFDYHYNPLEISLMATGAKDYFDIVLPATFLMTIGLFLPLGKVDLPDLKVKFSGANRGCLLFGIGFLSYLIHPYMPMVLSNFVKLMSMLIYIGFFYAFFSDFKYKNQMAIFLLGFLIWEVTKSGMFGEMILWVTFFSLFYFAKNQSRLPFKLSLGLIGIFLLLIMQSIKMEYRRATWSENNKERNITLFTDLIVDRVSHPEQLFQAEEIYNFFYRLNQGSIISKTIAHVPSSEPFAGGETVVAALVASTVPRFIWPNKPKAGGAETYPRFTGFELQGRTSANISAMGEAYVNFGKHGSMAFMFFFGLFINICFLICSKIAQKKLLFIFWIPMLFQTLIFLGSDLLTIFNAVVKTGVFIWLLYWGFRLLFKIKIF